MYSTSIPQSVSTHPATTARQPHSRPFLIVFLVWIVLQIGGLFTPGLLDDVDSIYVEVAREMLLRHDFITPYVDGIRFFDKPPLMYWLAAASMKLFGVHDWAARLPLALLSLALLYSLYIFGSRLYGRRAGFYASLAAATSIGPFLYTRFFIPDIPLALWTTLALLLFHQSLRERSPSRPTMYLFAAVMALDVLTKGLIGLVFPVAIILLYLSISGRLAHLRRMHLFSSLLVFLFVAAPWHILVALRNPAITMPAWARLLTPELPATAGWFWFYGINEHIMRFLARRVPQDYGQTPLWFFLILFFIWMAPWSAFLPAALKPSTLRRMISSLRFRAQQSATEFSPALLLICWIAVVLGFFCFSSRQEYYSLPALPALALLVGGILSREEAGDATIARINLFISKWFLLPLGLLVAFICGYFALHSTSPAPGVDIFTALVQHPEDYNLSLGHLFDLNGPAMGFFRLPLAGTAIGFFSLGVLGYFFRRNRRYAAANLALAAAMTLNLLCVHEGLARFYPILGSKPIADSINHAFRPGDLILADGEFTMASSINFYTRQPLHLVNGRVNGLWFGSFWPDAPDIFETENSLAAKWVSPQRIFLITASPERAASLAAIAPVYRITSSGGKYLLSNQP
jgi:4-amino-4-deoxy-L-arabinose transferase-like glycosyltransferase